jgi:hypothetical protein
MPELNINPEKVCEVIEMGRELAGLEISTAGDGTTTGDDSPLETLIEPADGRDPRRREMVAYLGGLDAEEQVNLLALILLGRGDFSLDEWDDALATARDSIEDKSADFLIGDPALPGYLLEALEAFGESCGQVVARVAGAGGRQRFAKANRESPQQASNLPNGCHCEERAARRSNLPQAWRPPRWRLPRRPPAASQ